MKKYTFSLRMLILVICAAVSANLFYAPAGEDVVSAEWSELRGVWVSTVANIDYPSQQTTNPETLKNDLISIMDNCKAMGFNADFIQVRPASAALYASSIIPWSRYLTGTQGTAPDGGVDPLAFAVQEAHARGMELHAWINPYRITNSSADNDRLAAGNPAVQHPELDRRAIGHDTRVSAHRVDFADNLSLGYSAYGRVARHLRELGHIHRHQQRPATHIGRRRRRLASGVPASYHDNVEFEFHIAVRRRRCRYKVRRTRAVSSFVRKTVSGTGPPAFSSVAALRAACRRNRTGGVSRE